MDNITNYHTPINALRTFIDKRQKYLEKKLHTYPDSAQAILLKGNKKKAILNHLPIIIYFVFIMIFVFYATRVLEHPICQTTFGVNTALLLTIISFYALPLGLFLWSLFFFGIGVKTIKIGYFPPLDSVQFNDMIATKTLYSKIKGYILIVLPIVSLLILAYAHNIFMSFTDQEPIKFFQKMHKEKCITKQSRPIKNLHVTF